MFFNNLSGIVRQDEGSHKQSKKAGCWIRGGWQGQDHFGGIKTAKTNTSCGELSFQLGRSWGLGLMLHFCMVWITPQDLKTSSPCWLQNSDGGSRGGPGGSAPIFILVKKKIVEGRKAGRESDKKLKVWIRQCNLLIKYTKMTTTCRNLVRDNLCKACSFLRHV